MSDLLTVTGMGRGLDGEYVCDIVAMIDISSEDALTVREANLIKTFSGARGGEIVEGFIAGDVAVRTAVFAIILQRAGKRVDTERLWDAKAGWARFDLDVDDPAEENTGDADPPPPTATNGGESTATSSASPARNQSPTGIPA